MAVSDNDASDGKHGRRSGRSWSPSKRRRHSSPQERGAHKKMDRESDRGRDGRAGRRGRLDDHDDDDNHRERLRDDDTDRVHYGSRRSWDLKEDGHRRGEMHPEGAHNRQNEEYGHRHARQGADDGYVDRRRDRANRRERSPIQRRRGEDDEGFFRPPHDEARPVDYEEETTGRSYLGNRRQRDESGSRQEEDELPELYSVHRARVQSVRAFGVFVRIEGFYKQGLVHVSQLSDHEVTNREDSDEAKVRAIAALAGEGEQVWVKVISLKDEAGNVKIGCSLKMVSQSTGKDLDPSNVKLDQQRPRGNRQEAKKVTLDAIYNVVCSRCGGHGHLKTECYAIGDKSYELLPEEDDDVVEQLTEPYESLKGSGKARMQPGVGRGRAMVMPAWMTHGTGEKMVPQFANQAEKDTRKEEEEKKVKKEKKSKASELPDRVTTFEEALALVAKLKKDKKDKHHKKDHRRHKEKRSLKKSGKEKS